MWLPRPHRLCPAPGRRRGRIARGQEQPAGGLHRSGQRVEEGSFLDWVTTPATPVRPYTTPPCHRPLSIGWMMPPPVTTESTSAMAAHATAGMMAKRQGLLLAQRMARLGLARHRAPAAATTM